MQKTLFQSMFSSTSGNVYKFTGEILDGENPTSTITEKFIDAAGINLMSIVVVQIQGSFVVYTDLTDVIVSENFEFLTDLLPDPVIEPGVITPTEVV